MVAEDDKAIYFKFGTELVDGWERNLDKIHEHAKKVQEKLDRARFKIPAFETSEAVKSQESFYQKATSLHEKYFNGRGAAFSKAAREQIRMDDEIARAQEKANNEALRRQQKMQADAEKAAARHHSQMLKEEKALADDLLKLNSSLSNARGEFNARLAREAEQAHDRAAKAVDTAGRKMEDSMLKAGKGAVEVARGLTHLGATNEKTAEGMLKMIVTFEAVHSTAKGGITIVRGLTDAWSRYRDVKLAVAAAEVAAAAAGGIRGASAAGSAAGSVASGVAGAAGRAAGGAGGLVGGLAGAVGGGGMVALGAAGVAAVGIVGTLYYFDKNFKAGVDKFLYGITDAEQRMLKRIDAGQGEAAELRDRFDRDRSDTLSVQSVTDEQIRLRARSRVMSDKSIPLEERGTRAGLAETDDLIADRQAKLRAAIAAANAEAANAQNNPNNQSALDKAERSAQVVVDLTRELGQLERERLGLTEQIKQVAVDGLNKQRDAAMATAAAMKQTADEAARLAEQETNKYRSDLEKFGAADPVEQDKIRRIKGKLDAGESLTAEESRLARGYNEFADAAGASDRARALAAGGADLFSGGEQRVVDAQAQASASQGAALGAEGAVANINNEIRILMEANTQDMARQIAENLEPMQTQLIDEVIRQIEQRRTAQGKADMDRRNKQAIEASRG